MSYESHILNIFTRHNRALSWLKHLDATAPFENNKADCHCQKSLKVFVMKPLDPNDDFLVPFSFLISSSLTSFYIKVEWCLVHEGTLEVA